jgi:hypothetical protein
MVRSYFAPHFEQLLIVGSSIPAICPRNGQIPRRYLCHNQTDPLPKIG